MATRELRNEMGGAENGETDEEEKWITHYSSNHQILLVGEGDFSFSLSLANAFASASNICASSLDSYDVLMKKYKNAMSNVENLEKLGASVLHEVDATKMKHHTDLAKRKFDRIIFNFPHAGFYGKEDNVHMIQMHRNLVQGFFRSARGMLRANGEIHVNHKTSSPFCLWNLEELASGSSLALIQRVDFNMEDYSGYHNKRGDGLKCDESFPLGESSTFKFRFCRRAKKVSEATTRLGSMCKKSQHFQTISMPMQLQSTSDFNYPQRNRIVNHIPLHVGLPSTIPNGNQYTGVFYRKSQHFQTIPMPMQLQSTSDFDYPRRNRTVNHIPLHVGLPSTIPNGNQYSRVFDRNLNGLVRTYQRNSYGVAYSERLRSDFDARYYVPGRVRHGLDRQMVEVPRTLNGNLSCLHEHELQCISNSRPHLRGALECQAYQLNAPYTRDVLRL